MGSITTKGYCVVKDGKAIEGKTKEDIVRQIFSFTFNRQTGKLNYTLMTRGVNSRPRIEHPFSYRVDEFTTKELKSEIIKDLFSELKNYGYKVYRDI